MAATLYGPYDCDKADIANLLSMDWQYREKVAETVALYLDKLELRAVTENRLDYANECLNAAYDQILD